MMRHISTIIMVAVALFVVACSAGEKAAPAPAEPMTTPPEPEKITAENAEAAADALEKEIAADPD